ncbi:hypothetical protein ACRRTK_015341 [Alexandromys fortis]
MHRKGGRQASLSKPHFNPEPNPCVCTGREMEQAITDKNCESALCSGQALGYPENHLDYLD